MRERESYGDKEREIGRGGGWEEQAVKDLGNITASMVQVIF